MRIIMRIFLLIVYDAILLLNYNEAYKINGRTVTIKTTIKLRDS